MKKIKYLAIPLIFLAGCQVSFTEPRTGLWVEREDEYNGWSVKAKIGICERFVRPIPKNGNNPWHGDEPAFVLSCVMPATPFISFGVGSFGSYLGFKRFDYTEAHKGRYWWWPDKWKDDYGEYVTISSRMTRNRFD